MSNASRDRIRSSFLVEPEKRWAPMPLLNTAPSSYMLLSFEGWSCAISAAAGRAQATVRPARRGSE